MAQAGRIIGSAGESDQEQWLAIIRREKTGIWMTGRWRQKNEGQKNWARKACFADSPSSFFCPPFFCPPFHEPPLTTSMPNTSTRRFAWLTRERVALAGLLLFALVVRGGVLFAMRGKLADDPDAYRAIAENLLRHGVFAMDEGDDPQPTAYRPPLYPVVLSNLAAADGVRVSLAKVAGLHLLLGVATVWLTWSLARRLQIGNCELQIANWGMPLVAGVIVACDPILLNQSALVMTETLAAFLAVLALWCLARFDSQRSWFNAGLAGGAMGLAVLCRPTFLPWVGLVAMGMLLVRGRIANCELQNAKCKLGWSDVGWRVANCVALLIVAGMVVSPWVIRNQRVFGKPIVTTTHGGYTLWLGNNHSFYDWLRRDGSGVPWTPPERIAGLQIRDWLHLSMDFGGFGDAKVPQELAEDRFFYTEARASIKDERSTFLRACFYRLGQLWSPLPNRLTAEESTGRSLLRYAVAAWYCGVYLLAAVGVWRLRWSLFKPSWVWGVLLCLVFTGVHTLYWSNLRMRSPLMPFVACVAAAALLSGRSKPRMDAGERG